MLFMIQVFRCLSYCFFLCAGIAAKNYSHVKYFKDRETYDVFYGILLRIVGIGVLSFAGLAQQLLVAFLRTVDPEAAEWFSDNWCGERGRYCLCHAGYAGSNSNMGVEVDWRDIKKLCPPQAKLGTFIGALVHFIRCLGAEHENFLKEQGTPGAFTRDPVPSKALWDVVQGVHLKTLSCSIVTVAQHGMADADWLETCDSVLVAGFEDAPLHLRLVAWHEDIASSGEPTSTMRIESMKVILMPRQHLLRRLDPDGDKPVDDVRKQLYDLADKYMSIVKDGVVPPDADIQSVLDVYENFHMLTRAASWKPVPVSCTCEHSSKFCICAHTVLFGMVFDSTLRVPTDYIAACPSRRKKMRMLKGTAGPRRARLLQLIQKDTHKAARTVEYLDRPVRSDDEGRGVS